MKNIYILGLLLAYSSWGMAADAASYTKKTKVQQVAQAAHTIQVTTHSEIMGLWGMDIPNNHKCVEYYNFRSNNDVIIKSAQEWSNGLYDYQNSDDHKERLPILTLQIKYDNNAKDCSGIQEDQTGEVSQYFIKWSDQNTINFCTSEKGEQCFATLHRVLP